MLTTTQRIAFTAGLFVGIVVGIPAGAAIATASAAQLPACAYEDGNTDGTACTWTDPDTGRGFYVDSANYQ